MSRPHAAALIEDALDSQVERVLRSRGWDNRVIAHPGYGSTTFVRVLARVILGRVRDEPEPPDPDGTAALRPPPSARGWRAFVTAPAAGVPVSVTIGDRVVHGRSDRGGHVDFVAHDHGLEPGWRQVTLRAAGAAPVPADVFIVADDVEFGIVSDLDDTVITTMLPRPMLAAWNTFIRRGQSRRAVPGMAPLYRALLDEHPGAPIVFVSTGAWNAATSLTRFLAAAGYPLGTLLLTDWGPTNTGWFRSGQQHKRESLSRLARDFPGISWMLFGDDGQHDPELYADFARMHPDKVVAVCIRELTPTEQVLSHPIGRGDSLIGAYVSRTKPTFRASDGYALAPMLRRAGLLGDRAAADAQPQPDGSARPDRPPLRTEPGQW
ncbi:phosphatase domain-containing protein [Intrasporangium sp.]|uniref:App1 family protein n=1 Tax=Intrasporangium sp. TaxID=1925024 RepID=UPI003221D5D6